MQLESFLLSYIPLFSNLLFVCLFEHYFCLLALFWCFALLEPFLSCRLIYSLESTPNNLLIKPTIKCFFFKIPCSLKKNCFLHLNLSSPDSSIISNINSFPFCFLTFCCNNVAYSILWVMLRNFF